MKKFFRITELALRDKNYSFKDLNMLINISTAESKESTLHFDTSRFAAIQPRCNFKNILVLHHTDMKVIYSIDMKDENKS